MKIEIDTTEKGINDFKHIIKYLEEIVIHKQIISELKKVQNDRNKGIAVAYSLDYGKRLLAAVKNNNLQSKNLQKVFSPRTLQGSNAKEVHYEIIMYGVSNFRK